MEYLWSRYFTDWDTSTRTWPHIRTARSILYRFRYRLLIGSFGLMGNSWGFDGSQRFPPMMSPWSKIQLGWINPIEIEESGTYEIEASALKPDIYIISSPFPSDEYLLIENRQPLKFDALLPQGGLLIWHIDGAVSFENGPGFPGQPNWPKNGKHYHVAVLQADGRYDLERGVNRGDSTDVWHSLSDRRSLGPSIGQPGIHPNTDSYQDGFIKSSGITVSAISPSSNKMSFHVTLPVALPPNTHSAESSKAGTILTTMKGGNGSYGVMFEIRSISVNPITVHSLSFHTRSTNPMMGVEVYTKNGSHLQAHMSTWTPVANTIVSGMGHLKETQIPDADFNDVRILAGTKQSFFIMLNSPVMRYTNMPADDFLTPFTSNSYFEILVGSGVGERKFEQLYTDRMFNGEVHYSVETTGRVAGSDRVLMTTFEQNNRGYGSMFDVKVLKSVIVTSMDIHTEFTGTVPVEIWTKNGGHKSFEQREDVWTKITAANVEGRGLGEPTMVPLENALEMHEGETCSFYVTLESLGLRYTNGKFPVTDENLQISAGTGVSYLFGNSYYPRTWNGALHYSTIVDTVTDTTLITTYDGGNGSFGCMFDVLAINRITIKSLEIHTGLKEDTWVRVYTHKGRHTVISKNWGKPIFERKVVGQGNSNPTPLPRDYFTPVHVLKGEIQAFYVTLQTPDLLYTNGKFGERYYKSNSDLSILEGTGIGSYLKFDKVSSPRIFNGIVHYEKDLTEPSSTAVGAIGSSPIVQIMTDMTGEIGAFGNIFDVKAKRNLKITSMNIHTSSEDSVLVEVWTRQGSHMGNTDNLDGWDRIAEGFVKGNGLRIATIIPQNLFTTGVEMSVDGTQAFYVTLRSSSMRYSKPVVGNEIVEGNTDLEIMPGHGIGGYPLVHARTYYPRAWNGCLLYQTVGPS